jgi:hypothetical protein
MLPILDEVAGSMRSGPESSGMAGTLTTEDTGDDIEGEELGGVKTRSDASKRIPPACTVLIHNLYIVDNIFNYNYIRIFNYLLEEM